MVHFKKPVGKGWPILQVVEKLEVIRRHLLVVLVIYFIAAGLGYAFSDQLFNFAVRPFNQIIASHRAARQQPPADEHYNNLIFITPLEAFMARWKMALYAAFLVVLPLLLYISTRGLASLGFITRSDMWFVTVGGTFFFWVGAVFAYYVIIPAAIEFFLSYVSPVLAATWTLERYTAFIILYTLVFGVVFEMPMILLTLSRIGLITPVYLREKRGLAMVLIFTIAAVFTPPDIFSQMLMGIPMVVLYEVSLLFMRWFGKKPAAALKEKALV